jgi:hypothetical protein
MALLKAATKAKRKQMMIYMDESLLEEISRYSKWAGIDKFHDFIEQAAKFVFSKDTEWKKRCEVVKR